MKTRTFFWSILIVALVTFLGFYILTPTSFKQQTHFLKEESEKTNSILDNISKIQENLTTLLASANSAENGTLQDRINAAIAFAEDIQTQFNSLKGQIDIWEIQIQKNPGKSPEIKTQFSAIDNALETKLSDLNKRCSEIMRQHDLIYIDNTLKDAEKTWASLENELPELVKTAEIAHSLGDKRLTDLTKIGLLEVDIIQKKIIQLRLTADKLKQIVQSTQTDNTAKDLTKSDYQRTVNEINMVLEIKKQSIEDIRDALKRIGSTAPGFRGFFYRYYIIKIFYFKIIALIQNFPKNLLTLNTISIYILCFHNQLTTTQGETGMKKLKFIGTMMGVFALFCLLSTTAFAAPAPTTTATSHTYTEGLAKHNVKKAKKVKHAKKHHAKKAGHAKVKHAKHKGKKN